MKCDVCGKEIKEEESYKGCCLNCASKIFDRIETKNNNNKFSNKRIPPKSLK